VEATDRNVKWQRHGNGHKDASGNAPPPATATRKENEQPHEHHDQTGRQKPELESKHGSDQSDLHGDPDRFAEGHRLSLTLTCHGVVECAQRQN
jgi:hypothetical protein